MIMLLVIDDHKRQQKNWTRGPGDYDFLLSLMNMSRSLKVTLYEYVLFSFSIPQHIDIFRHTHLQNGTGDALFAIVMQN